VFFDLERAYGISQSPQRITRKSNLLILESKKEVKRGTENNEGTETEESTVDQQRESTQHEIDQIDRF
jgi:hypothetical protein